MNKTLLTSALFFAGLAAATDTSAAPKVRPDFHPNAVYKQAGAQQAQKDFGGCSVEAEDYLANSSDKRAMLGNTARKAARGAAKGAVAGSIFGEAGRGAGAGAAVSGIGAVGDKYRENRDGSPEYRKYVETCLEEKGYKVIGWK